MGSHSTITQTVTKFLVGRARLGRVTTYKEVAKVVQRQTGNRVSRNEVASALREVAKLSWQADEVILPVLVLHWNDNRPGHRFAEWAKEVGAIDYGTDVDEFAQEQLEKVFSLGGDNQLSEYFNHGASLSGTESTKRPASLFA